jgi:hypothetical protein
VRTEKQNEEIQRYSPLITLLIDIPKAHSVCLGQWLGFRGHAGSIIARPVLVWRIAPRGYAEAKLIP